MAIKIGDFTVQSVDFGTLTLDGGAMFGVVPKVMWEKTNPADNKNRITLATRGLVVRGRGMTIVVDTGSGTKGDAKFNKIYGINAKQPDLVLREIGIEPEEVTHVVVSHLHFDHCGGSTLIRGDTVVPVFPKARYLIQKAQYAHAAHPTPRDRASFMPANYEPLAAAGLLDLVDGPAKIADGLSLIVSDGHTTGQQLLRVEGPDRDLIFMADLVPTMSHLPVPYVMAYDMEPVKTMQEKDVLLTEAVENGHVLVFEHDPFNAAAVITKDRRTYKVKELIEV